MIKKVSDNIAIPLIIGGGIRDVEGLQKALDAGAQVVVVGNAIEKNPDLIAQMSQATKQYNL
jgi:putative glycerol-1-phosphate prenyltransferase